jgi:hypothetical protein
MGRFLKGLLLRYVNFLLSLVMGEACMEGHEGSQMGFADGFVQAFRNLNSVVVPAFVGVPKNEEQDAKKGL